MLGYLALGSIIAFWCLLGVGFGLASWRAYRAAQAHAQGH